MHRALGPVEGEDDHPGDDRREGKRQVDDALDEPLAREAVAHQDPGDAAPATALMAATESDASESQIRPRLTRPRGAGAPTSPRWRLPGWTRLAMTASAAIGNRTMTDR